MGEPSGKRSLHLRLEARLHDELQQLAGEAGSSIPDLVRDLLERALRNRTHLDILNCAKATAYKLDELVQAQGGVSAALQQRLDGIEQLICSADANAAQRRTRDHAHRRCLFESARYGLLELQTVTFHLLEQAMLAHGHGQETSRKFYTDCQDVSSQAFDHFLLSLEEKYAAIEAGAPAPLQLSSAPAPSLALHDDTAKTGDEEPESNLPTAPVAAAAVRHSHGNSAAANTAGEGA